MGDFAPKRYKNHANSYSKPKNFSIRSEVKAFIQGFLPKWIGENIDFRTLKQSKDSFINEELEEFFSDIVYDCKWKTGKIIQLSLLLEHKSYVPKYPLLQILEYILFIWKADQKQKRALTLVISIVIYHVEPDWKHKELTDMFEAIPDFMQPFIPNFKIHLTNISKTSDATIEKIGANFLTNTFLALKYSRQLAYPLDNFKKLFIFRELFLNSTLGDNQFKALFVYLGSGK